MPISDLLTGVAAAWTRTGGMRTPAHQLLAAAGDAFGDVVPVGYLVEGSGGKGVSTFTPWIAVFDPDETTTAQHGMYVVYIYTQDMQQVTLSLNQGVTEVVTNYREQGRTRAEARARLATQAAAIREALPGTARLGLTETIALHSPGPLQRDYEAGCILALTYDMAALPSEASLRSDLQRFVSLYQDAVSLRSELRLSRQDAIATTTPVQRQPVDSFLHFKPKSDADYIAHLAGVTITKSRRHETLIAEFGRYAASRGMTPGTNVHPRDLVLIASDAHWLVEAKVVYRGNATQAVRDAIGQLFTYRHVLYQGQPTPRLAALFSEGVGDAYVELLDQLEIASVWRLGAGWRGSPLALASSLVDQTEHDA